MEDDETGRIFFVANPMSSVWMMEIMRQGGLHLNRCHFRSDIWAVVEAFKKIPRAVKLIIVENQMLADYAKSRRQELSCFVN
jgi:hypothetical protein